MKNNVDIVPVLEILAEGDGLVVTRIFLGRDKYNQPEYLFHWEVSGMGLEDDEPGFSTLSENTYTSMQDLLEALIKKYPEIFILYANLIHKDYRLSIIKLIRKLIQKGELKINELNEIWLEKLNVSKYELTANAPFDAEEFAKFIHDFVHQNRIDISEIKGWDLKNYTHSDFENIREFSKFLDRLNKRNANGVFCDINKAGVYAYFIGDKCLYIGKAKRIKDRLLAHYKSAHLKIIPKRGKKHKKLFNRYINDRLDVYHICIDDKYESKTGELFRKTIEGMLQLKYEPEFEQINYEK